MLSKWLTDTWSGTKKNMEWYEVARTEFSKERVSQWIASASSMKMGKRFKTIKKTFETYLQFMKKRVKPILV